MAYFKRHIDGALLQWKDSPRRKPLLIRGARQVGKSTAVREFGKQFRFFVEVNLEKQPDLRQLFSENIDVKKTCEKLSGTLSIPIVPGETLLFIDEIQVCKEAIMALRYFKEDFPDHWGFPRSRWAPEHRGSGRWSGRSRCHPRSRRPPAGRSGTSSRPPARGSPRYRP